MPPRRDRSATSRGRRSARRRRRRWPRSRAGPGSCPGRADPLTRARSQPGPTRGAAPRGPRPEHRRPEDGVEAGYVLIDAVEVGRPPLLDHGRVVGEAAPGDVVDEGVVPDVDGAGVGVPRAVGAPGVRAVGKDREGDPPPGPGAADREVLEAAADEAQHLVAPELGLDELGMLLVPALQALLVSREPEEPVLLGQPLERDLGVIRADRPGGGLDDVGRVPEALVGAVPALVRADVDVAVGVGPADHLLADRTWSGSVVRMKRSGRMRSASSAARKSATFSSTKSRGVRRSSAARIAMLTLCSSVPVRKRVGVPRIRCQRASALGADHLVERVDAGLAVGIGDGRGDVEPVGHGGAIVAGARRPLGGG